MFYNCTHQYTTRVTYKFGVLPNTLRYTRAAHVLTTGYTALSSAEPLHVFVDHVIPR